jgi:hypothetical protein
MPNLLVDDIVEATFKATYQGSTILNVFHFKVTATAGTTDYDTTMSALGTTLIGKYWSAANLWRTMVVPTYILNYVRLQRIRPFRAYYIDSPVNQAGAEDMDGIPSNLAAVIVVRSELTTRGKSGSKHLTGMSRNELEPDVWSNAMFASLAALGQEFREEVLTAAPVVTYKPVIYDRLQNTAANIVGVTVIPEVRIMRRRTKGVGI